MRACSFPARIPFFRLCCVVCIAAAVLSADARNRRDEERPEWIAQPKGSDLMYLYVVGHAAGRPSETDAQDAAYRNALQKIAAQIPTPDGKPVPPTSIQRAEVVPGCRYVEEAASGKYEAWVQVSWPAAEKQRLMSDISSPAPGPSDASTATTSSPDSSSIGNDKGSKVGAKGGVVENSQAGIKMTIPPGALKETGTITIVPQAQHPPIFEEPLPAELADAIRIGPAVDLGPSGTRFQVPVEVQWRLPDELRTLLQEKGARVEVGYYNGEIWQPFQNVRINADGTVSFQTTHFTLALPVIIGTMIVSGAVTVNYGIKVWLHPEKWIKADSQAIKDYIKAGNVKLPDAKTLAQSETLAPGQKPSQGGRVSLGLGRSFDGLIPWVLVADGETMLTQKTAFCQEATFFAASILRASGDPRFQNFICVGGGITDPTTGEKGGHMWIEIEIDGKIWVVDTFSVKDISLMSKDRAYKLYKLTTDHQFTDAKNSRKEYVGLKKPQTQNPGNSGATSNTVTSTKWKFSGVSPGNWEVSYNEKGLVMQRKPAKNKGKSGESSVTASLYAEFPTAASGKDSPKTAGDCLAVAEKAFKSRRQGKTPNDPAVGLDMVGGVEGANSFSIGDFPGAMADYALWMRRGSWGDGGYSGSYFGSNGDGSAVKENMIIRFGYSVNGGGCWDNSDRAYLVSQGTAAQQEARAILASLRAGPDGDIKQEPYKGPKYDGSDIPK